jgi:hypothetical protein
VKDPVDHVIRPNLPWRVEALTECGKPVADVRAAITRDQAVKKVKDQGQQRAAMSTCMTCWSTAERHRDWAAAPAEVMAREVKGVTWYAPGQSDQINRELRAIAAIVDAHRDEFDAYLAGLDETVSMDRLRAKRDQDRVRHALHRRFDTTL